MMNKSLRGDGEESSSKVFYGFHWMVCINGVGLYRSGERSRAEKKRAAVSGGFEVDNREASNRVDRSHSVSKRGRSHS